LSVRQSLASSTAAVEVAGVLLQLGLEARKEREGVGGGAGKPGQDLVLVEAANLFGRMFQHVVAQRDLPIGGHDHLAVAPHANHGGGTNAVTIQVTTTVAILGIRRHNGIFAKSHEETSENGASCGEKIHQDAVKSISQRANPGSPATGLRRWGGRTAVVAT
jgi:hypothetical protein